MSDVFEQRRPWIAERARLAPGCMALECRGRKVSFVDLSRAADNLACGLLASDVAGGDRVALVASPSVEGVALAHALQRIGATLVPLSLRASAREVGRQLDRVRPALVVHDETHAPGETAGLRRSISLEGLAGAGGSAPASLPDRIEPSAALVVLFTSGTEREPKAVVLSNAAVYASAVASARRLGINAEDRWLCPLPLWHVGGLSIAYRAAVCGFTAVVHPSFDVGAADTALREDGVTVVSLVPTMLGRLLERGASSARYPALRVVLLGGASLSPTLARVASGAGLPLFRTYGLTEAASQVTTTEAGEAIEHPRSSGRPLEGVELRIDHPDARGRGEILVRGPQLMDGYLDDSRANDRVLAGGWLHTGDTGTIDAAGRLVVADRRADVIVSGGENVSPSEVEAVLCEHPDVVAAGVFGEPDAEWGERVGAAVVLAEGARVDARGLRDWCRERLAGFKLPRRIAIVDALPTNDSGKIRRSQLRGLVASGKA